MITFTVETDGRLPTGQPLVEAIGAVDEASDSSPAYYMINCAHSTHFEVELQGTDPRLERLGGLRVNASCRSHAELNDSNALDEGNPAELADQLATLTDRRRSLNVFGGCCGTDERHIDRIAKALHHRATT